MKNFNYQNLCSIKGNKIKAQKDQNTSVELLVSEVEPGNGHGEERECFVVRLEGDKDNQLSQGSYQLEHDVFGEAALFISPNSEIEYEIVINREL